MSEAIINSDVSLQSVFGKLRTDYESKRYLKVRWIAGSKRSINQNDITHVWYDQIARELPEDDERGWKRFCKLHFGVPILRAEDDEFREAYDRVVRPHTYEDKLQMMDILPVTSRMTKTQLSKYAEDVQKHFHKRGVILEFPKEAA